MQREYLMDGTTHMSNEALKGKHPLLRLFEYHVREYSRRDLSFDSDALDGVRSILDRFPNDQYAIDHVCGLAH